jgi:hypothetical protein
MSGDITCSAVRSELDFDRLEPQQLLRLEGHIRVCKDCTLWRAQVFSLTASMQKLEEYDVPDLVTNQILHTVENLAAQKKQIPAIWIYSLLAVAAVVYLSSPVLLGSGADSGFSWLASLLILVAGKFLAEHTHILPERKLG